MLNYLRGELYRLLHKTSLYVYFGALLVGYLLIVYIRSGGFTAASVVNDAITFFNFLPALAGGFLFAAIYTDDLNSRNLTVLVGFGMGKARIVLTKLIVMILLCAVIFGLAPLIHCAAYAVFGWSAQMGDWQMVYAVSLKYLLMTLAFAILSAIVVYGTQRTTFSVVCYILLAFGVISGLMSVLLNTFAPDLIAHLISGITDRIILGIISGGSLILPTIEYGVYTLVAIAFSVLAFHKKEMEF